MTFFKNKIFIVSLFVVVLFIFALIVCAVFMSNNLILLNRHINTKNISEIVVVDDKSNKTTISSNNDSFNVVKNILDNSKIQFFSDELLEYDTRKDYIELNCNGKTKTIYTYSLENGKILLVICDFFKNSNTPKKLDNPYYIIAEITSSDFYSIFPNSTLLSNNCITIDVTINDHSFIKNQFVGKLLIRNDNDCDIRLSEISCSDEDISIITNESEIIAQHSGSEIDLIINTTKDVEYVKKHMKNLKLIFSSSINPNDTCEVLYLED